ncbi:hypothetical protein VTL71DRAFT_9283 [Oculimacula yallundae]|uniref:3'-5' exonuclease domain-containing protein n=1 Tax=Oculimacula yallundae TaxID=86028 RepID=A0ABR4BSK3_9HELO
MDFSQGPSTRPNGRVSAWKAPSRRNLPFQSACSTTESPPTHPTNVTTISSSLSTSISSTSTPLSSTPSSCSSPALETEKAPRLQHTPAFNFSSRNQMYSVDVAANSPGRACRIPRRTSTTIPKTLRSPMLMMPSNPIINHILDKTLSGNCGIPPPCKYLLDMYRSGTHNINDNLPRIPYRMKILVDTVNLLIEFLGFASKVRKESAELFLDEEGNNHGKDGVLCTIQVTFGAMDSTTFILDVVTLGEELFNTVGEAGNSVKGMLEDPAIYKVFFDVRNDSAALFHQYGIKLQGIIDVQIMELCCRYSRTTYLSGLNKCIDQYLWLCSEEREEWSEIKNSGRDHCGNDYSLWEKRPLPDILLSYAANDTVFMPHLFAFFRFRLECYPDRCHRVVVESARRVQESQQPDFESSGALAPVVFR